MVFFLTIATLQMDEEVREPVVWVKESSISSVRIGHNANHGFQILRGVPKGNPRRIVPPPLDHKSLTDVAKTFSLISEAAQAEWNQMKEESVIGGAIEYESAEETFDWAKSLLMALMYFCDRLLHYLIFRDRRQKLG